MQIIHWLQKYLPSDDNGQSIFLLEAAPLISIVRYILPTNAQAHSYRFDAKGKWRGRYLWLAKCLWMLCLTLTRAMTLLALEKRLLLWWRRKLAGTDLQRTT
uniref:Uncharacterized protein n=1 Tax=Anguilla anguilla TaxID=7936 RepID=A0A0E9XP85_ANGAN